MLLGGGGFLGIYTKEEQRRKYFFFYIYSNKNTEQIQLDSVCLHSDLFLARADLKLGFTKILSIQGPGRKENRSVSWHIVHSPHFQLWQKVAATSDPWRLTSIALSEAWGRNGGGGD